MKKYAISIIPFLVGLILNSCTTPPPPKTGNHLPVRVYLAPDIPAIIEKTAMLPPLGIKDSATRKQIEQKLFQGARRHFINPLKTVNPNSAYANYISEKNLMNSDGTLNISEVVVVGQLMNVSHVICPIFKEIRPYHPQRISLQLTVIDTRTGETPAELSGVFDLRDQDIQDWFERYQKRLGNNDINDDTIRQNSHSPNEFQSFISDSCFELLSDSLPF